MAVTVDTQRRLPGRGAWLHPDDSCLTAAIRRRAFARALRITGSPDINIPGGGSTTLHQYFTVPPALDLSGAKIFARRNSRNGMPAAFSTIRPAMTKLVLRSPTLSEFMPEMTTPPPKILASIVIREAPIFIKSPTGVAHRPVVQQGVARSSVERQ